MYACKGDSYDVELVCKNINIHKLIVSQFVQKVNPPGCHMGVKMLFYKMDLSIRCFFRSLENYSYDCFLSGGVIWTEKMKHSILYPNSSLL